MGTTAGWATVHGSNQFRTGSPKNWGRENRNQNWNRTNGSVQWFWFWTTVWNWTSATLLIYITESSHASLEIRLSGTGSDSRADPDPLTYQSTSGNHQLVTSSSTQIPAQRPTLASLAPATVSIPEKNLNPGHQSRDIFTWKWQNPSEAPIIPRQIDLPRNKCCILKG